MRRWVSRGTLAAVALVILLAAPVGVKAFNRACDGSLEGLRYLANVRTGIAAATALPPTPAPAPTAVPTLPPPTVPPTPTSAAKPTAPATLTPTPTPPPPTASPVPTPAGPTVGQRALEAAGIATNGALGVLVLVKQSDAVAYPLHIVTAHTLSAAGCGRDAVRLQWLKAGLHASREGQPQQIATELGASASNPDDLAELRRIVRTWTERASDNVPLRRVLAALDERA